MALINDPNITAQIRDLANTGTIDSNQLVTLLNSVLPAGQQISTGTLEFLKEDVQTKIATQFPNIVLNNLNVLSNSDYNSVTVEIFYSIANTGTNDNLTLNFN